ncbi:mate-domain-containing protein [Sparassis latifolia]
MPSSVTYPRYSAVSSNLRSDRVALLSDALETDDEADDSSAESEADSFPGSSRSSVVIPQSIRKHVKTDETECPTEDTPLLLPVPVRGTRKPREPSRSTGKRSVYWEELRTLTKYTLPVFGTQLFEYSLVIASVISIGHLSTTALAASTLGSMTESVTALSIFIGFTSALDTVLPSAWTSSHPELVGLWAQRMVVVLAVVLVPIIGVYFNSEAILLMLKQDPEVAHLAATYLKWSTIGLPAYAFNGVARRYFQSQGLFSVPTYIILVIAPINALLNYVLVWGPKPFGLGFIGAPIASSISFNLISLASIAYGVFFVPRKAWHPLSFRCFTNLGVLVRLGFAGVGQVASEWWSWELVSLASSMLGPVALAAQSIVSVSSSTTYQAPYSLGVATTVRVGNLLGKGNAKRAGVAANLSIYMSLGISMVWSTMFLVFRHSWAYLFNDDPEVVALVASLLPLLALFQVVDGLGGVTSGILRARGMQSTGAVLNFSAYYILGIPFGMWLTFRKGMGLAGLWIGLTVAMVYCAIVGVWLCVRTNWEKEVEKVQLRVAADQKAGDVEAQS